MAGAPSLSVVIPTRDRCDKLALTLAALERQHGVDEDFEVVVVDDGSVDGTAAWLAARESRAFRLSSASSGGRGPAAARNLGIRLAGARRVLLLGDDTIPTSGVVASHFEVSGGREVGVQGFIKWDPSETVTDVMRFLAPEGPQFWFKGLNEGMVVPFTSVYGSNLSAPSSWFRDQPFDEGFPAACFEDTEMAWRWSRRHWTVVFSARAVCHHRHHYDSIEPILERQRRAGAATRTLVRRHPRLLWRMLCQPMLAGLWVRLRAPAQDSVPKQHVRWDQQCRKAWLAGLTGSDRLGSD